MIKDAEKRGRILLTSVGLGTLMRSGAKTMTRSEVFDAERHLGLFTAAETREIALASIGTGWQSAVLDRMVKENLLELSDKKSGKSKMYICRTPEKMHTILKDHENFGFKLSKLLFPGEVMDPTELVSEESEPEEPEAPVPAAPVESETSQLLKQLIPIMSSQRDALESITEGIQQLVNDQASIKKRQGKLEERLGDMLGVLNSVARKTVDAGAVRFDPEQLVQAFHSQTAALEAGFRGDLAPLALAIDTTKTAAIKTHGKLEETLRLFKSASNDRMGKALRDLTAAAELIGDALTEESNGHGGD